MNGVVTTLFILISIVSTIFYFTFFGFEIKNPFINTEKHVPTIVSGPDPLFDVDVSKWKEGLVGGTENVFYKYPTKFNLSYAQIKTPVLTFFEKEYECLNNRRLCEISKITQTEGLSVVDYSYLIEYENGVIEIDIEVTYPACESKRCEDERKSIVPSQISEAVFNTIKVK